MIITAYFWKKVYVLALCGIATIFNASAADWSSCADDLDRLRRAARDAADKANDVRTKADEFENCKRFPEIHDLLRDRCRSKNSEYQSALSYLDSELRTVDSRIRSVSSSCGFDLGSTGRTSIVRPQNSPSSGNSTCDLYRSYKDRLPFKTLLETCVKTMADIDCRKCLSDN